jgi:adenylate cyclase
VVVGEIGELKKEIAFLGDAVNTAARIEEACRDLGRDLILSKAALDRLAMPVDFNVVPLGRVHLRGKREELELYALETGEAAPAARAAVAGV